MGWKVDFSQAISSSVEPIVLCKMLSPRGRRRAAEVVSSFNGNHIRRLEIYHGFWGKPRKRGKDK